MCGLRDCKKALWARRDGAWRGKEDRGRGVREHGPEFQAYPGGHEARGRFSAGK